MVNVCFVFLPVMWNVYGECDNFATLKGHSGAVMELHYNTDGRCVHSPRWVKTLPNCTALVDGGFDLSVLRQSVVFCSMLFSASTDKTVGVWDSETGERIKRLKGHTSFVNTCYPARRGPQLICTGSDDGTVKVRLLSMCFGKHHRGCLFVFFKSMSNLAKSWYLFAAAVGHS